MLRKNHRRAFARDPRAARAARAARATRAIERLEHRWLLSTINWVNRGDGTDSFDTVFGANDNLARAVVDAALDAWERLITNFQQQELVLFPLPHLENPNTIDITLSVNPANPGFGGGAGNPATYDVNGTPLSRGITINSGQDTDSDGQGDGVGWYLDPNPNDHAEFAGPIFNPFVGQATPGGAASGLRDLYSLVTIEMNHALGLTNFGSTPAWTGNPFLTNLGIADSIDAPGTLWTFSGSPSGVTALLTTNNGGPGGNDTGNPLHVALPGQTGAGIPAGFSGALDVGNASLTGFPRDLRFLPSNLSALMLQDVYGYTLAAGGAPVFGTMHALWNSTTNNVLVRGMTGTSNSNDIINISRSGAELVVSVDVGADVAGTGPTGPLVSRFNIATVTSLTINGLDGNDTINVSGDLSFLSGGIVITGDAGTDTLTIDFASGNPVPAAGLSFDGGSEAGTDLLVLQNGSFASETHNATGPSSGNITFSSGGTITYTGLEPVDDTVAVTNFTFNAPNTADVVAIENSPVAGRSRIRSANSTFELLDYANKTNVTINGLGGGDTFNLTATVIPPGLATLTVNGGAASDTFNVSTSIVPTLLRGDDGADLFHVNGTGAGGLKIEGGDDNDVVNVNDTGSMVIVDGNAGSDTINVFGSGNGTTLVVNGVNDNDVINIFNSGVAATLTVNGNDGDDTINVSGTGAASLLTVNGNNHNDTINVTGNGAGSTLTVNGNNGDDRINVTGAGLAAGSIVQFNGQIGDDTFDVTSSPLVVIPVNGGPNNDTLKVNGETLDYDFTTIAGTSIFSTPGRADVTSVQVELLDVRNGKFTVINSVAPNVRVHGVEDGPATLDGTGVIVGTLTADPNGTVSPAIGAGVAGILSAGSTTLNAGSTYFVDLNGLLAGVESDLLNVTGTVTINNGDLAGTLGFVSIPGDEIMIIRNDGADPVVGKFAQGDIIEIDGKKFAIDYAYDGDNDGNFNDVALIRYGAELAPDPCNPGELALFVSATTGNDQIRITPATGSRRLLVEIEAVTQGFTDFFGPFDFKGLTIVFGQSGDDLLTTEAVPSREVWLFGQVGNDTLLSGNNNGLLLGGNGNDTARGGNAKDILIGGRGEDLLRGGNADSLLIGGYIDFESNTPANREKLCAIFDEWVKGTGGWKGKIDHLTNGGGKNGLVVLNATTVFDDAAIDQLFGGSGKDWFLAHTTGLFADLLDADKNEVVTEI